MNVVIVGQHADVFRDLEPVMRELCRRGHQIVFLLGSRDGSEHLPGIAGVEIADRLVPDEPWPRRLRVGRQVVSCGIYSRRDHPSPEGVAATIERSLPDEVRAKLHTRRWRSIVASRAALHAWRWLEAASPASAALTTMLERIGPDVMLVSPPTSAAEPVQADYLRAARALGVPAIACAHGWDDLTAHGTLHLFPDLYLAWNEPLAREAVDIHEVPAEAIRITGAPHLDPLFSLRPLRTRAEVCAGMGRQDAPYIVFLGSPRTIWDDESFLVRALADALARELGDRAPFVAVRPHPANREPLADCAHPGVVVLPGEATGPEGLQEHYDLLVRSACVFGLNTPAFLDAVVADRPCLTIVGDMYWPAQGRTGHFRYLLAGGFLETSRRMGDVASRVRRILDGTDERAAARGEFARSFLRPCGLDSAAGEIVADLIESTARPRPGAAPVPGARRPLIPGLTLAKSL